jgi:hypothetical protein
VSPVPTLLAALFQDEPPRRLVKLIDPTLSLKHLVDYALNPVLNSDPERPTRLAVARTGDRSEWIATVAKLWRSPAISAFFQAVPAHHRQMIDSDGGRSVVIYNDDLQPPPAALLAMSLSLPKGGPEMLSRCATPPILQPAQRQLTGGQWAIRQGQTEVTGVLWVSESRWRGDALRTTELLMALEMSGGWQKRWDALKTAGLHPYPDAIEFRLDGTVDLTVGFLDAAP